MRRLLAPMLMLAAVTAAAATLPSLFYRATLVLLLCGAWLTSEPDRVERSLQKGISGSSESASKSSPR
jgi:hypothetical protein